MSRHDAVHAIAFVLSEHMRGVVQKQESFDMARYAADIGGLTKQSWLERAGIASRK
jgi:hypothetical protein